MDVEFYLVAPPGAEAAQFLPLLKDAFAAAPVAALLLPREGHSDNGYKSFAKAVIPVAQDAGVAVLIEGDPGLVRVLGADGLHVAGDVAAVKAAITALKPQFIVGAAGIASRHDAMIKGELGPDYVFFGPSHGPRDPEQREMARWWAEVMTVPAVLSDTAATAESASSDGCEFISLGESLWSAPEGAGARLKAIAGALKVAA
ncbi:MAG TPA: thiamine phosphate synthase [Devosia sp.]|nr:thiamine phosphate synthase [Devosia sp.]